MLKQMSSAVAGASRFAHLLGLARSARAEDDKPPKKDGDEDDPKAEGTPGVAPGTEETEGDKNSTPGVAPGSSGAEDDAPAKGDDDKDDEKAKARAEGFAAGRAAGHAEGVAQGAKDARERCAAIFASPAAANNIGLAAQLAFESDMPAGKVISALEKAPAPLAASRAARNPNVGPGATVGASNDPMARQRAIDNSWDACMQRASGRARQG